MGEIFLAFLKLGLTSFGGPVAHLSYFRAEFVTRRKWLDEESYANLLALCQILPGPTSSQLGLLIGNLRGGLAGAAAAFAGFTLPSFLLMLGFAYGVSAFPVADHPLLHGLKLVAVAVVADAVLSMARTLTPDLVRIVVAALSAALALLLPGVAGQLCAIFLSAVIGVCVLEHAPLTQNVSGTGRKYGRSVVWLALFFLLLLALPVAARMTGDPVLSLFDAFYRSGSLVFGGGHVVLPLLQQETVVSGWVGRDVFVAGYGAAQALPGPLFAFAGFLGAQSSMGPGGVAGGMIAVLAIYLPSFLLLAGVLPLWNLMGGHGVMAAALRGINAGVVGLLAAALYQPVAVSALGSLTDLLLACVLFAALVSRRIPVLAIVAAGALAAWALALL